MYRRLQKFVLERKGVIIIYNVPGLVILICHMIFVFITVIISVQTTLCDPCLFYDNQPPETRFALASTARPGRGDLRTAATNSQTSVPGTGVPVAKKVNTTICRQSSRLGRAFSTAAGRI